MSDAVLHKVAAFITRQTASGIELLLLAHPYAGNQLPAGTVEENEDPRDAVLREAREETGVNARVVAPMGYLDEELPRDKLAIVKNTIVYARPDATSFDWARVPRGNWVRYERAIGEWTQITYEELDQYPDAKYATYRITGWVPNDALTRQQHRHFFHLIADDETRDSWTQFSDNHQFRLFWAPLAALPEIVSPQNRWVEYVLGMTNGQMTNDK
ncbi:MAG: NUDIX domain-containing protein [Chloroflexi bacterium]|nr:NUDIX domain-containing protein [Chloroflexota bacterium]